MEVNFLVSSAGRRGELVQILRETIRLLQREGGVYCVDRSPLSAAAQLGDGFDLVPSIGDRAFIPELKRICRERKITHVIPTIDTELPILAEHRTDFEREGVKVWVSSPETVGIAQDKRLTNRWLKAEGVPSVRQVDLAAALNGHELEFPVIAKPARGSSSVGLTRINAPVQLAVLDPALDYVVEEMAMGVEHTVDLWVDSRGVCRSAVPRRRIETRAGEISKGLTVRNEAMISLARDLASALPGARGVLNVQLFANEELTQFQVIEINARFGGGFPLAWAAGAQMPVWSVLDYEGVAMPEQFDQWTERLLMLRYDQGVYLPAPCDIT